MAMAEPLLLARGRLERTQERASVSRISGEATVREGEGEEIRPVINVIVRELAPLERFLEEHDAGSAAAPVRRLPGAGSGHKGDGDGLEADEVGTSMRAAAPPVQSFAMGRRR